MIRLSYKDLVLAHQDWIERANDLFVTAALFRHRQRDVASLKEAGVLADCGANQSLSDMEHQYSSERKQQHRSAHRRRKGGSEGRFWISESKSLDQVARK
ncbi:hypothetical protein [Bradyrhizobium paxllaeri]|uniref:hypothetical protein n=1 Tax=Bradyrhizobium paxllaeri TaxID=190148 RepID=UPI0008288721|nr:hypothetical protein [Bradyrhizobium paxllaeri]